MFVINRSGILSPRHHDDSPWPEMRTLIGRGNEMDPSEDQSVRLCRNTWEHCLSQTIFAS